MLLAHIVSLVLRNRCCSDLNGSQKILRILKRQSNRTKIGQREMKERKKNSILCNDSIRTMCFSLCVYVPEKLFVGGIHFGMNEWDEMRKL